MTGSRGRERVPAGSLGHFLLPICPVTVTEALNWHIVPLIARASRATSESRNLAALRDALHPKLISGDLRVKEADRLVADSSVDATEVAK